VSTARFRRAGQLATADAGSIWLILGLHVVSAASVGLNGTVVKVGSATTFNCTASAECSEPRLHWSFAAVGDGDEAKYLNNRCGQSLPRCSVTLTDNNRTSSLTLNDIQLTDAGLYYCAQCWDLRSPKSQALSVIGKN